jgi:hypothetical protein
MGEFLAILAGFSAFGIVVGIAVGRIGNARLLIGSVAATVVIGVALILKSTERHGDGMGSLGFLIFGIFAIWAAVLMLLAGGITGANRADAAKQRKDGDDGDDSGT